MRRLGRRDFGGAAKNAAGFTLIEVMIAVVVLGFGLLGFALLQTMSVRFVQSANYRTQATNLSYELLDQIRVNRVMASAYSGNYTASVNSANCQVATGSGVSAANFKTAWQCRLGKSLGAGATAVVARNGDTVRVSISWGDERWVANAADTTFVASTRL